MSFNELLDKKQFKQWTGLMELETVGDHNVGQLHISKN